MECVKWSLLGVKGTVTCSFLTLFETTAWRTGVPNDGADFVTAALMEVFCAGAGDPNTQQF